MIGKDLYDLIILCNHTSENHDLPTVDSFDLMDVHGKSILIFFAGTEDLMTFIEKDERSKVNKDQALQMFNYSFRLANFGVKQLRVEEQMFIVLSKLVNYTY